MRFAALSLHFECGVLKQLRFGSQTQSPFQTGVEYAATWISPRLRAPAPPREMIRIWIALRREDAEGTQINSLEFFCAICARLSAAGGEKKTLTPPSPGVPGEGNGALRRAA